jgi:hypothetical protein
LSSPHPSPRHSRRCVVVDQGEAACAPSVSFLVHFTLCATPSSSFARPHALAGACPSLSLSFPHAPPSQWPAHPSLASPNPSPLSSFARPHPCCTHPQLPMHPALLGADARLLPSLVGPLLSPSSSCTPGTCWAGATSSSSHFLGVAELVAVVAEAPTHAGPACFVVVVVGAEMGCECVAVIVVTVAVTVAVVSRESGWAPAPFIVVAVLEAATGTSWWWWWWWW